MAGEPVLIVDDTPVNLKLTRILLVNEGYKVLTATSAEEALDLLRSYHPDLILADVQLPGIDGLELTRRIKRDSRTRDISVVALTAFAMKGDEQKAIAAGCDGYITKPIDTRALGARIREFLDRGAVSRVGPTPPPPETPEAALPPAELQALRRRFLEDGQEQVRQWLLELDGEFKPNDAAKTVHQWIGGAGLLGFTALTRLARELEAVLFERPLDQNQLRESLTALALAFSNPRDARDLPIPEALRKALGYKRIALVGLPANDVQRLSVALERAEAIPVPIPEGQGPRSDLARTCDVAVVYASPETASSPWLHPVASDGSALVLVGRHDHLLRLDASVQAAAHEFLMDGWQPEEACVRLSLALRRRGVPAPSFSGIAIPVEGKPKVTIADDDRTVLAVVSAALRNFGMDCQTVADGPAAAAAIRASRPNIAVLDLNMPHMDGFEVLAAIRAEQIPVRILVLSARQQEGDVLRAFALGADDYVVKPFSPLELVARLKRLLQ